VFRRVSPSPSSITTPENRLSVSVRRVFKPALRRAQLPEIRSHDLRHSFASLLIAQGERPKLIAEQLGHASVNHSTIEREAGWAFFNVNRYLGTVNIDGEVIVEKEFDDEDEDEFAEDDEELSRRCLLRPPWSCCHRCPASTRGRAAPGTRSDHRPRTRLPPGMPRNGGNPPVAPGHRTDLSMRGRGLM
jgi:hypothetical protein